MENPYLNTSTKKANGLQVIVIPIEEGVVSIRGLSSKRIRFELEYALERGTTANSFLFNNTNHQIATLIHPPGVSFNNVFLEKLNKSLPDKNKDLSIIVGHINPNRIALIKNLVQVYSKVKLICSAPGAKLLTELWNQEKPNNPQSINKANIFIPIIPTRFAIKFKITNRLAIPEKIYHLLLLKIEQINTY